MSLYEFKEYHQGLFLQIKYILEFNYIKYKYTFQGHCVQTLIPSCLHIKLESHFLGFEKKRLRRLFNCSIFSHPKVENPPFENGGTFSKDP